MFVVIILLQFNYKLLTVTYFKSLYSEVFFYDKNGRDKKFFGVGFYGRNFRCATKRFLGENFRK